MLFFWLKRGTQGLIVEETVVEFLVFLKSEDSRKKLFMILVGCLCWDRPGF